MCQGIYAAETNRDLARASKVRGPRLDRLWRQPLKKGARGDDANALIVADGKQIVIAGDDVVSASFHRLCLLLRGALRRATCPVLRLDRQRRSIGFGESALGRKATCRSRVYGPLRTQCTLKLNRFLTAPGAREIIQIVMRRRRNPRPLGPRRLLKKRDHRSVGADAFPRRPLTNGACNRGRDVSDLDRLHDSLAAHASINSGVSRAPQRRSHRHLSSPVGGFAHTNLHTTLHFSLDKIAEHMFSLASCSPSRI